MHYGFNWSLDWSQKSYNCQFDHLTHLKAKVATFHLSILKLKYIYCDGIFQVDIFIIDQCQNASRVTSYVPHPSCLRQSCPYCKGSWNSRTDYCSIHTTCTAHWYWSWWTEWHPLASGWPQRGNRSQPSRLSYWPAQLCSAYLQFTGTCTFAYTYIYISCGESKQYLLRTIVPYHAGSGISQSTPSCWYTTNEHTLLVPARAPHLASTWKNTTTSLSVLDKTPQFASTFPVPDTKPHLLSASNRLACTWQAIKPFRTWQNTTPSQNLANHPTLLVPDKPPHLVSAW